VRRRHPRVRQPRPVRGGGQHPGRRGHALGGPAPGARSRPGAWRLFLVIVSRVHAMVRRTARGAVSALVLAMAGASPAFSGGDSAAGEELYTRCAACHALERNRTGPKHCGLFGRRAGSVPGYDYSQAMKDSGIVWNARTLDRFLADPMAVVAGTSMGYAGVRDDAERAALIAFLESAS